MSGSQKTAVIFGTSEQIYFTLKSCWNSIYCGWCASLDLL